MTAGMIADRWDRARRWRRVVRYAWRLGSPLAVLGACGLAGLRLNLTGSLPIGLYRVSRATPVREAIVLADRQSQVHRAEGLFQMMLTALGLRQNPRQRFRPKQITAHERCFPCQIK